MNNTATFTPPLRTKSSFCSRHGKGGPAAAGDLTSLGDARAVCSSSPHRPVREGERHDK